MENAMKVTTAYQHDAQGYYVGEEKCYGGVMPNNCVATAPKLKEGFAPRWSGKSWEQIESHIGEEGYINGRFIVITERGPYPEGWSKEFVDPRSPEEIRKAEILLRLDDIDRLSVRALRASRRGSVTVEDEKRLDDLETEAEALRTELASLS
jgi:hypothetical protein